MNVLLSDLVIGESPRWHDGRLWFCHWMEHEVIAVDLDGKSEVVMRDETASPHSIEFLADGRMLILPGVQGNSGMLLRREHDGSVVTHADLSELSDHWNEIVVDGRGNIYVNSVGFDFIGFLKGEAEFHTGTIALVKPDGSIREVADGIEFANGMVVTADNSTLIVSESFGRRLTAFDIDEDGNLSNRHVFADDIGADGICIDADGAIWTSDGEHTLLRVADGGEVLQRIQIDRMAFALMLGGPERKTLFVMAAKWNPKNPFGERTGQVLTFEAPARGVGWP